MMQVNPKPALSCILVKLNGFTLLETLIAMMILAGGLIVVGTSWSGNQQRLTKARLNNTIAMLLERKMTEIEAKYKEKPLEEVQEEAGEFEGFKGFSWEMKATEFEVPDMSSALISREGGADEMLLMVIRQLTDYIKQTVKEVTVTVVYNGGITKNKIKNSVTTYFVDYKKEVAIGPAGSTAPAGGAPAGGSK